MGDDEVSVGELYRLTKAQSEQLREVLRKLDSLNIAYIPRGEHELVIGGIKMDLSRIETTANRAARDVDTLDDKIDSRFRTAVITVVSALIFPGVIALVVWLLTLATS